MDYLDPYRDKETVLRLVDAIRSATTKPWTIMEVCGGQTHAIIRYGIDSLLPDEITLVHGPGCPVCVTPVEMIDQAIAIAGTTNTILCSFGDMLRVPGSETNLLAAKSNGADVRMVYSPMDALRLARQNPDREVVFFAVGFETTAPANAMALYQAREQEAENFSMLVSHVLVPPAMEALLEAPENAVDGFLAAGHVCAVMGIEEYPAIAEKYEVPIVVTGFEPVDLLRGVLMCVRQLESGRAEVENQYARSVRDEGNLAAREMMSRVFRVVSRQWRGMGEISQSGFAIAPEFARYDAALRFPTTNGQNSDRLEEEACISGRILQGLLRPDQCPHFGTRCTPEHPMGATMVSSEGACAAYFRYRPAESVTGNSQDPQSHSTATS